MYGQDSTMQRWLHFIKHNHSYILWFLFFFYTSFSILKSFHFLSGLAAFLICLLLYGVSIVLALTVGERILRYLRHARPVETAEEKERFLPLFEDTVQRVKSAGIHIPDIQPYLIDSAGINALAIGKRTVAVTKGALEVFNDDELQAILFHEIAHIKNGNTVAELLNKIGNGFYSALILLINGIFTVVDYVLWDSDESGGKEDSRHQRTFFLVIRFLLNLYVQLILFIGNLFLARNNRKSELLADRFAYDMGFGDALIQALYLLQQLSFSEQGNLTEKLLAKHPRVSLRIGQLEALRDKEKVETPQPVPAHTYPSTLS